MPDLICHSADCEDHMQVYCSCSMLRQACNHGTPGTHRGLL
jgi:hypothetical protein